MTTVSDSSLPLSDITGEYPENSIERQPLKQMSKSTENYWYDISGQLEFELSMCREIANAIKQLNSSGMRSAALHKSECNSGYWERISNGGFLLKDGVKPSGMTRGTSSDGRKYGTGCATAMVIVYYRTLLEVLPEETLNRLFPSIYLMNWYKLDFLLRKAGVPKPVADILLGDRCYFINSEVDPEVSELQGENVITLSGGLHYGHRIGITTADRIICILNANRIKGATQSTHLTENSAARPDFKKLEKASQSSSSTQPSILNWRPFPQPILGQMIQYGVLTIIAIKSGY